MKLATFTFICLGAAATAQSCWSGGLDGYWQSDGYGTVAEVKDGRARAYQVAGEICHQDNPRWERLSSFLDGITITLEAGGQTAVISAPFAQHRIRVRRLPALPDACAAPADDTALGNFDAFVAYFAHNYAFFDLYGVDWSARVAAARAKVRPDMTDTALFKLMAGLMAPLRDGHLELDGSDGRQRLTFEPNIGRTHRAMVQHAKETGRRRSDVVDAFHEAYWTGNVRTGILNGQGRFAGNKRVQ